ncbi:hypothetical protein MNBD_GAMMA08-650 [hydrothermal vent metagenome]|uniref:ABC-type transport auxiliary lipoprotein component domain-containing protein n=1 Tax=hydrothermal vent metagenome TaxID=652676 RepID=A0A3B0X5V1_9ZZZZ
MFRFYLLLIFILSAASCSLGGDPAPQDHFFRLPEIVLDVSEQSQKEIFENVVIKPVKASGLYHERAILFIEADKPLELQRYHYSFWASTPAELIHQALIQGLQSSGLAKLVSRNIFETRPDYIIDTRIVHFERLIDGNSASIHIALDVSLRSGDVAGQAWNKRYVVKKKLASMDMHTSAEAFGDGLKEISTRLKNDL